MPKANETSQQLVASYICSAEGAILSSPQQQLVSDTEWLSTSGHHVLASSSKSEHLKHAIAWVESHRQGLAMMHAIEGGAASLWHELAATGSNFLAVVPASTRFWHQTGTTTAKALSRQLQFNAVSDLHAILGFTQVAGAWLGEVGLWIAREPIELRKRNRQTLHLELVCLRVVNRYSNEIIRDQVVLLHAPTLACADATLAGWLVTQAELKLTSRLAAAAWPITAKWQAEQGLSLAYHARATALFAAAASNAMLLSREQSLRHLLLQLLPNRAALTAPRGLESLLRLFALKEVLQ